VRAALLALGVLQLAIGLAMVLAPGAFFELVGPYGTRNDHYLRDMASWELALAAVAFVAAGRPSWRVPVLTIAAVHYALHALNHLVDVGEADPAWLGPLNLVLLAVGAVLLVLVLRVARRDE
jgi:hypothetical protein